MYRSSYISACVYEGSSICQKARVGMRYLLAVLAVNGQEWHEWRWTRWTEPIYARQHKNNEMKMSVIHSLIIRPHTYHSPLAMIGPIYICSV